MVALIDEQVPGYITHPIVPVTLGGIWVSCL